MGNNARIMKNTLLLYVRMLFLMVLSLYTSRITLQALGVVDYGIYNVIGGVVTLFAFVQMSVISSSQRFISYAIGKGNKTSVCNTFNLIQLVHGIIALLVVVLLETVGLWFVYNKLEIPSSRFFAALVVFQVSIAAVVLDFMSAPYNALLISKENMKAFAYIDILGGILRFTCVFLLLYVSSDRLPLYAILILSVSVLQRILYQWYCKKHYEESHFHWYWNKKEFMELLSFSGWTTFSAISTIAHKQGMTIIVNWFVGVTANAAVGLANQASGAINKFTSNFQQAFVPQIVKSYAEGDINRTRQLVFSGAKVCTILLLYLALPVIYECEYILNIWLKEYPRITIVILQLILIETIIRSVTYSMQSAIRATGKIKVFEIINNIILLVGVVLSYFLMKMGGNITHLFLFQIIVSLVSSVYIIYKCGISIEFRFIDYFKSVVLRMLFCLILCNAALYPVYNALGNGIIRLLIITALNTFVVTVSVYVVGLTTTEKKMCKNIISNRLRRHEEKSKEARS